MKRFDYIRPDNLNDAISAMKQYDNPFLLAGGTDLLNGIKTGAKRPDCIVDLKTIPKMDVIIYENGFKIGALTSIRDIEVSSLILQKIPVLSQAAGTLGSVQIRNRATIGGNLCHGSPAADMATILLAMDSKVRIVDHDREKTICMDQFFAGPNTTVLRKHEVLAEIIIPKKIEQFKGAYLKHSPRKAMDIGIVNIGILLDVDINNSRCNQIFIALGAVAPTPIRAKKAEELLNGNMLDQALIQKAAEAASNEAKPISDFRASATYRKDLVKNLIIKGINQILYESDG
jgi:CO/xanthine dehydrogenase FAD-binding subunit